MLSQRDALYSSSYSRCTGKAALFNYLTLSLSFCRSLSRSHSASFHLQSASRVVVAVVVLVLVLVLLFCCRSEAQLPKVILHLLLLFVVVVAAAASLEHSAKKIVPRMTFKQRAPVAAHRQKQKRQKKNATYECSNTYAHTHMHVLCNFEKSVHKPGQNFNRKINTAADTLSHVHEHTHTRTHTQCGSQDEPPFERHCCCCPRLCLLLSSFVLGVSSSVIVVAGLREAISLSAEKYVK